MEQSLKQAYEETEYRVHNRPDLVLRIGIANAALAVAHEQHGVSSSLFLTAWNPYTHEYPCSAAENQRRQQQLLDQLEHSGLSYWPGIGQHPSGAPAGEESVLIFGVTRDDAKALGIQYEQNAVVWSDRDAIPKLIFLR